MKNPMKIMIALLCAAGPGACAPVTDQSRFGAPETQTTLVVRNNNISDMVIYALRGNTRMRLGSVAGMSKASFKVSSVAVGGMGDLRIMADPIGSRQVYTSPIINVVPGAEVELRLEEFLQVSSFSVF